MTSRVAVYIAGDAGIYFPALVAFDSIQRHNTSNPFDYFVCFDGRDLTGEMDAALCKRNITFVDTAELTRHGSVEGLSAMKENRWPNHVFYNWLFPYWLHERGYESALKVDYDLLCLGRYYLSDLMPSNESVSALTFRVNLLGQGVNADVLRELDIPVVDNSAVIPYYNAGVVGISLKDYVSAGTFEIFRSVYMAIQRDGNSVTNAEQAALAIVAFHSSGGIREIPTSYNQRINVIPEFDSRGKIAIKNVHYLTQNKPWLEPDYRYLEGYTKDGRTAVYIYREIWHEYAKNIEGYERYVPAHSPTSLDRLEMFARVLSAYHS